MRQGSPAFRRPTPCPPSSPADPISPCNGIDRLDLGRRPVWPMLSDVPDVSAPDQHGSLPRPLLSHQRDPRLPNPQNSNLQGQVKKKKKKSTGSLIDTTAKGAISTSTARLLRRCVWARGEVAPLTSAQDDRYVPLPTSARRRAPSIQDAVEGIVLSGFCCSLNLSNRPNSSG